MSPLLPTADLTDVLDAAGNIASIAGAVLAALAIAGGARGVWRRTFGRRQAMERAVSRLGLNAQLSYFEAVLGGPPAIRGPLDLTDNPWAETREQPEEPSGPGRLTERVRRRLSDDPENDPEYEAWLEEPIEVPTLDQLFWSFADCWVQAFIDETESVVGFSVTQRARGFCPRFEFPPADRSVPWWRVWDRRDFEPFFSVRLGKSKLSDLGLSGEYADDYQPVAARFLMTVRPWLYADIHYLGNPGYYMAFVAATSSIGNPADCGDLHAVQEELGFGGWPPEDLTEGPQWSELAATRRFREETTMTTFGVMSSQHLAERIPWWGPHGDEVRMLLDGS